MEIKNKIERKVSAKWKKTTGNYCRNENSLSGNYFLPFWFSSLNDVFFWVIFPFEIEIFTKNHNDDDTSRTKKKWILWVCFFLLEKNWNSILETKKKLYKNWWWCYMKHLVFDDLDDLTLGCQCFVFVAMFGSLNTRQKLQPWWNHSTISFQIMMIMGVYH